jgi:hypothetical protein
LATLALRLLAFAVPIRARHVELEACNSLADWRGYAVREVAGHILRHRITVSEAFLRVAEII